MAPIKTTIFTTIAIILWLSSLPITPSMAQLECWQEINTFVKDHRNQTASNPKFNPRSPSFNQTEFFCCSLMQNAALTDKQCFCQLVPVISEDPNDSDMTSLLNGMILCNVTDSLRSLESFCGVPSTPALPPSTVSLLPPPTAPPGSDDLQPPPALTPHQAPGSHSTPGKKKQVLVIIVAVALSITAVLMAIGISLYIVKASKKSSVPTSSFTKQQKDDIIKPEFSQYELGVLEEATNDFSDDQKIGEGGFGAVYKGTLPNGEVVAIKRLSKGSWQGDEEFENEVTLVAKLQHKNLVRLMGFCMAKEERLLVYELMENKSLDYFLFDPDKQKELNWSRRYNIIRGIARGMLYLHEDSTTRIVHRDLKASNVLLDDEMNPKIADFGMARIFQLEQTHGDASQILGTYGYMAPEYMLYGKFSTQSDVYSFGVLVLEIVSGKKVTSTMHKFGFAHENLLSYAWRCFKDGRTLELMDSTLLRDSYSKTEIIRCIHMGLLCVQEDMRRRPTMGKVFLMFESDLDVDALWLPQHPPILSARFVDQSTTTTTTTTGQFSAIA